VGEEGIRPHLFGAGSNTVTFCSSMTFGCQQAAKGEKENAGFEQI
jgi:hypothetical protein